MAFARVDELRSGTGSSTHLFFVRCGYGVYFDPENPILLLYLGRVGVTYA